MALCHHVGVTIGITLDKNGSLYDPSGTESCDMQIRLVSYLYKDEYIYIGLRWPPAATYNCAQVHHRSPAGTFTRVPGRCLHWSPTPPGTPVTPRLYILEVLHLYRCVTHTHSLTLTHSLTHSVTHSLTHTYTLTRSHSLTHTHLHTHTHTH